MIATTEAGRWLLANVKPDYTPPESGRTFTEHVAAIEAESRRATVERIRERIGNLSTWDKRSVPGGLHVMRSTVFAILDEELRTAEAKAAR